MRFDRLKVAAATVALLGAGVSSAVIVVDPIYTFCEMEDNDLCVNAQVLDSDIAVSMADGDLAARDCFMITGKLQEDCVWDNEPKCALRIYGKHVQCYTSNGQAIPGEFYEPLLAQSDSSGLIDNFNNWGAERTIRLAVAAQLDAGDGTINGLNQNAPHGEWGEVTVKVFHNMGSDRGTEPNQSYVFRFQNGSDALRVAFVIPAGPTSVDIMCCDDTGTVPVCYDVDFYTITHLIPNKSYCLTVVGGLDKWCNKTNTKLGWFDKDCQILDDDDDSGQEGTLYSKLCVVSDGDGALRFAVSGGATQLVHTFEVDDERTFGRTSIMGGGNPYLSKLDIYESGPIGRFELCLKGLDHDLVGEIFGQLSHLDPDQHPPLVVVPFQTFLPLMGGPSGSVDGDYCFSNDLDDPSFFDAAYFGGTIPEGTYNADALLVQIPNLLDHFRGRDKHGLWVLTLEDPLGFTRTGSIDGWCLRFDEVIPGDCNFNGLLDQEEFEYFQFLNLVLALKENLPGYDYRPGASTKDESIDEVNRYPRRIWDEYFEHGRPPEAVIHHGVCGEYCIKLQLAQHVEDHERHPPAPGVMGSATADLNRDGAINAVDLATLLSVWGDVPQR